MAFLTWSSVAPVLLVIESHVWRGRPRLALCGGAGRPRVPGKEVAGQAVPRAPMGGWWAPSCCYLVSTSQASGVELGAPGWPICRAPAPSTPPRPPGTSAGCEGLWLGRWTGRHLLSLCAEEATWATSRPRFSWFGPPHRGLRKPTQGEGLECLCPSNSSSMANFLLVPYALGPLFPSWILCPPVIGGRS